MKRLNQFGFGEGLAIWIYGTAKRNFAFWIVMERWRRMNNFSFGFERFRFGRRIGLSGYEELGGCERQWVGRIHGLRNFLFL